ncbi:hypothetical protein HY004_02085 [Candidatus Saccharibacteria bacterium]|nr:hypothetical protein [Candidatus Saccharibacteria bacterium]
MSGKEKKVEELRGMFITYLFDMSWKLAISFLTPFFIALFFAHGNKMIVLAGIGIGLALSVVVISTEIKRINKAVDNV